MGNKEILKRIWLFSANKMKKSLNLLVPPTQLIVKLNSSLRHLIVTYVYKQSCFETPIFLNCQL